eukprot:2797468-Lingulodinium_polyedra.AAC.1
MPTQGPSKERLGGGGEGAARVQGTHDGVQQGSDARQGSPPGGRGRDAQSIRGHGRAQAHWHRGGPRGSGHQAHWGAGGRPAALPWFAAANPG